MQTQSQANSKIVSKQVIRKYILQPETKFQLYWNLFVTTILVFTCIMTPFNIAFYPDRISDTWRFINYLVDFIFLADIIIIFNTGYVDEDGEFLVVQDYGKIAKRYLQSWFIIDLVAVVPIDLFFGGSNINGIVRITRIGRMYRLIRLTRMLRVLKIIKEQSRIMDHMQDHLKIGIGFQRLLFFVLYTIIFTHVLACFWTLVAQFNRDKSQTWLGGDADFIGTTPVELYLTSVYFVITTITTVGYGDMSGGTKQEKFFCIILMLFGVIAFSFSTGSLASILQNYDTTKAQVQEKLEILNRI